MTFNIILIRFYIVELQTVVYFRPRNYKNIYTYRYRYYSFGLGLARCFQVKFNFSSHTAKIVRNSGINNRPCIISICGPCIISICGPCIISICGLISYKYFMWSSFEERKYWKNEDYFSDVYWTTDSRWVKILQGRMQRYCKIFRGDH